MNTRIELEDLDRFPTAMPHYVECVGTAVPRAEAQTVRSESLGRGAGTGVVRLGVVLLSGGRAREEHRGRVILAAGQVQVPLVHHARDHDPGGLRDSDQIFGCDRLLDWYAHHGGSRLGAGFRGMGGMFPQQRVPLVQALLAAGADPNVRITSSAMIMSYIGYPKKGAFEPYACGTGDLRGATPLWVAAFGANGSFGQIFAEFAFYNMANSSADVVRALLDGGAD